MATPPYREVKRRIQAFFDERAADWDEHMGPAHAERLARIVDELDIVPGSRVLDVGTGNGVLLPLLEPVARLAVALDVSANMLVEARQRAHVPQAAYLQADALDLPLPSCSFDMVICNSCFPHFQDQRRATGEMARVLTNGGRLVICHTRSRHAINQCHHSHGGVIGGHETPDAHGMSACLAHAGLRLDILNDGEDRYLVVARKPRLTRS